MKHGKMSERDFIARLQIINRMCNAFEDQILAGRRPMLETELASCDPSLRADLLSELLYVELYYLHKNNEFPTIESYFQRFPENHAQIALAFKKAGELNRNQTQEPDQSKKLGPEQNLLFAVISLQLGIIDPQQFVDVCDAWANRQQESLASILLERNWISGDDRVKIERLTLSTLTDQEQNENATRNIISDAAVRDVIERVADPEVRASLIELPNFSGNILLTCLETGDDKKAERYSMIRIHKEGGLGRVWLVHDNDLNRDVALKEIRKTESPDSEVWQRFVREARVTGQLEHPNIVPVHELDRGGADKQPFYTMQFVRGRTLGEAISDYHTGVENQNPMALRQLLDAFVNVCNAVGYAHTRGVIHRDLKPENVILGEFGEVMVLDWGLAKLSHEMGNDSEQSTAITDASKQGNTIEGTVFGTPAYMSPEQAAGQIDQIESRSDIYGLGAILFEILVGHPPHQDSDRQRLLDKIINAPSPQPREFNAQIAPALNAICNKAMSKEIAERYENTKLLSTDVQRWLAGETVSVYSDPVAKKILRWGMRRRSRIRPAALTFQLGVIVVLLAIYGIRSYRASQMGSLELKTSGAPLSAEIIDIEGHTTASFNVPHAKPIGLAEGSYTLRLSAPHRLSESYRFDVTQGKTLKYTVGLDDRKFHLCTQGFNGTYQIYTGQNKKRIVWIHQNGIEFLDAKTCSPIWKASFPIPGYQSKPNSESKKQLEYSQKDVQFFRANPELQPSSHDIDGDSVGDLIWRGSQISKRKLKASFLAISGASGKVLWHQTVDFGKENQKIQSSKFFNSSMLYDADKDTISDVVSVVRSRSLKGVTEWFMATVSGKDGTTLSSCKLQYDADIVYPLTCQSNGDAIFIAGRQLLRVKLSTGEILAPVHDLGFQPAKPPQILRLAGYSELFLLLTRQIDSTTIELSLVSSKDARIVWQKAIPAIVLIEIQHNDWIAEPNNLAKGLPIGNWPLCADLDSDGKQEIIVPSRHHSLSNWSGLLAIDVTTGKQLWQVNLKTSQDIYSFSQSTLTPVRYPQQLDNFVVGPDLDGDGFSEIFVTSHGEYERILDKEFTAKTLSKSWCWKVQESIYVTAISGQDGSKLWTCKHLPEAKRTFFLENYHVDSLQWWHDSEDGLPGLVVGIKRDRGIDASRYSFLVSIGSGKINQHIPDLVSVSGIDLDGDSIRDMVGVGTRTNGQHGLFLNRGSPQKAWSRLGTWIPVQTEINRSHSSFENFKPDAADTEQHFGYIQSALARSWLPDQYDLNGDGMTDVINISLFEDNENGEDNGLLEVVDGATGDRLWQYENNVFHEPDRIRVCGDFDCDGVVDLLSVIGGEYALISGKNGRSAPIDKPVDQESVDWPNLNACGDLNRDGVPDFAYSYRAKDNANQKNRTIQYPPKNKNVAVISGQDGLVLWTKSAEPFQRIEAVKCDVNETSHLATTSQQSNRQTLSLLSGIDGSELWSRSWSSTAPRLIMKPLDLDRKAGEDILVAEYFSSRTSDEEEKTKAEKNKCRLQFFSGKTGESLAAPQYLKFHPRLSAFSSPKHSIFHANVRDLGPIICIEFASREAGRYIAILDGQLKLIYETETAGICETGRGIVAHDLDSDGFDELIYVNGQVVEVWKGVFAEKQWECKLADAPSSILKIIEGNRATGPMIIVRSGHAAVGLAPDSGEILMRWPSSQLLIDPDVNSIPRCLVRGEAGTICYYGQPTNSSVPPLLSRRSFSQTHPASQDDPRLARNLPWVPPEFALNTAVYLSWGITPLIWFGTCLALLILSLKRRSMNLVMLFVGMLMVAGFAYVTQLVPQGFWFYQTCFETGANYMVWDFLIPKWCLLAVGLPLVVFPYLLIDSVVQSNYKRLKVLGVLTLAACLIRALVLVCWDSQFAHPSEHYSLTGWYLIGFMGVHDAAWLFVLMTIFKQAVKFCSWVSGRMRLRVKLEQKIA